MNSYQPLAPKLKGEAQEQRKREVEEYIAYLMKRQHVTPEQLYRTYVRT